MDLTDLVTPKRIAPHLKASCKKRAIEALAAFAGDVTGADAQEILEKLQERERLGSTGVGGGVAIPHGRIKSLDAMYGVLARLDAPVDFDSIDEEPVDLIFLLLTPEDVGADHLKALARISRFLRDKKVCDSLRGAESAEAMYAILSAKRAQSAA